MGHVRWRSVPVGFGELLRPSPKVCDTVFNYLLYYNLNTTWGRGLFPFFTITVPQCLDQRSFNKCLGTITIHIRELNTGFQTMSKQLAEGKRPYGLRLHPRGLCPKYIRKYYFPNFGFWDCVCTRFCWSQGKDSSSKRNSENHQTNL